MNIFFRGYLFFLKHVENAYQKKFQKRFKFLGENVRIESTCKIFVPENFEIGDNSSISDFTTIYATFGVSIGKNCLISSNCGISSYNHIQESYNRPNEVEKDILYSKKTIIGDNVWIGMNACILPGVIIGDNSIVGSGSVVTKSIPKNEIWVGNPAKFVKSLSL